MQIKRIGGVKDIRRNSGLCWPVSVSRWPRPGFVRRNRWSATSTPITARARRIFRAGCRTMPPPREQFFDPSLRKAWSSLKSEPYDFLVQSPTWKLGAVSISILRRQFDKTYVAVAFDNHGRAGHAEFHPGERTRGLGDFRCRKPARFTADVSRAVQELMRVTDWRSFANKRRAAGALSSAHATASIKSGHRFIAHMS